MSALGFPQAATYQDPTASRRRAEGDFSSRQSPLPSPAPQSNISMNTVHNTNTAFERSQGCFHGQSHGSAAPASRPVLMSRHPLPNSASVSRPTPPVFSPHSTVLNPACRVQQAPPCPGSRTNIIISGSNSTSPAQSTAASVSCSTRNYFLTALKILAVISLCFLVFAPPQISIPVLISASPIAVGLIIAAALT